MYNNNLFYFTISSFSHFLFLNRCSLVTTHKRTPVAPVTHHAADVTSVFCLNEMSFVSDLSVLNVSGVKASSQTQRRQIHFHSN